MLKPLTARHSLGGLDHSTLQSQRQREVGVIKTTWKHYQTLAQGALSSQKWSTQTYKHLKCGERTQNGLELLCTDTIEILSDMSSYFNKAKRLGCSGEDVTYVTPVTGGPLGNVLATHCPLL